MEGGEGASNVGAGDAGGNSAVAEPQVQPSQPSSGAAPAAPKYDPFDFDDPSLATPSKKAAQPAVKPVAAAPAAKEIPGNLPDELVTQAKAKGLTDDEIQALGAERVKNFLARQQAPKAPEQQKPAEGPKKFERFKLELNPDEVDPQVADALGKMNEHYASHLEQMLAQLEQANGYIHEQTQAKLDADFGRLVDGLGREYEPLMGKGKVDPNSEAGKNRQVVIQKMNLLATAYRQAGQVPDFEQVFKEALHAVHGEQIGKLSRKQIAAQLDDRKKLSLPRTTHRLKDAELKGEELARANVKAKLEEFGVEDEDDDEDLA